MKSQCANVAQSTHGRRAKVAQNGISRREFSKLLGATALGFLASKQSVFSAEASASASDLTFKPLTELARMVREKKISSVELVEAHIKRIEAVHKKLNAVVLLDKEGALKTAKAADESLAQGKLLGPLHGVPMTIKDSFDTAGMVSTAGTQGRAHFVPEQDATVVAHIRKAGAVILGKTNTPELTLSFETDNLVYGRTNNPYDLARTPGGSSGGAAAIIAAGGSPADVGSDTEGSLRIPAAFCGIASLKPTYGRVSRAGHIIPPGGVVGRRTHVGPLARYVNDLTYLLPILSGADSRDPDAVPATMEDPASVDLKKLRVAFFTHHEKIAVSPEIDRTVRSVAKAFADFGMHVEEKTPPGFQEMEAIRKVINTGDGGDYYRKILRQCGTTQPYPATAEILDISRSGVVSGRKYSDVLLDWNHVRESALDFMSDYDLIICPTCSGTAPEHGHTAEMEFSESFYFNMLGWPAATVRAGTGFKGLPIGVQVVAKQWFDHVALAAAQHIEQAICGYKRDFAEKTLVSV